MLEARASPLQTVTLFTDCATHELAALEGRLLRRRYARDQLIFQKGDPGTGLYIVERGRVKLSLRSEEGKEIIFDLLGPGAFFGELALLDGEPRSADATAMEPSDTFVLSRADFLRQLDDHPPMAVRLLSTLTRRLRRDTRLIGDAAFLDVPARLARVLLDLAGADGRSTPEGVAVRPRLNQTELAGMVGATRVSVNKWLQFFQQQGLISQHRGQITILKSEGLLKRIY